MTSYQYNIPLLLIIIDRQTDATERPTHAGGYTLGVGN